MNRVVYAIRGVFWSLGAVVMWLVFGWTGDVGWGSAAGIWTLLAAKAENW